MADSDFVQRHVSSSHDASSRCRRNAQKETTKIVKDLRGHYITHLGGIKQCKSMVIFSDFPYYNALFGLVSYNGPLDLELDFPQQGT